MACENCGGEHETPRWWDVVRFWFNFTPREWNDGKRFAFAVAPYLNARSERVRRWWSHTYSALRVERIMREQARQIAQESMTIQLRYDDPRASALMMYLFEGRERKEH